MSRASTDWAAIDAHPKFQALHQRKSRFLWTLMIISIVYYFLLPIGAAYYTDWFKIRVWGPVNAGLLFALSQFIVAWVIAFVYSRHANRTFDPMAEDINRIAHEMGARQ